MMTDERIRNPLLVLDFKKKRIRIHKITLKALENPEFIQFLINPKERLIVITKAAANDHLAHKVNYKKLKKHCYELYSLELVTAIHSVVPSLENEKVYKFCGSTISNHSIVLFPLDNAYSLEQFVKEKSN